MAKEDPRFITESGVTIPESDVKAIRQTTLKQMLVGGLAAVGAGTVLWFARGFANGRIEINTVPTTPIETE